MKNKEAMNFLGKNMIFFAISKGIAFLTPILFVKFVTIENYGVVEYAYSMGSVLAVALMLGLNGAYPYFILKRNERDKEQAFFLYGILLAVPYLIFSILLHTGHISESVFFVFLFSAIFALQRLYSTILKSNDKGYLGVIFDGGYYFLLAAVIIICIVFRSADSLRFLRFEMECYFVCLSALFFWRFIKTKNMSAIKVLRVQYPTILHYSLYLVLSGFIIYWLTSSARIYIKYLMGYEQVGIYSFYFRLAGIAVALFQFFYVAFFKKLYMSASRKLDSYFCALISATFVACVIVYFIAPVVVNVLNLDASMLGHDKLLLLLSVQMPLWVGISLNEGIISRENLVRRMVLFIGTYVAAFFVLMIILKNIITLELFTYLSVLLFAASFLTQIWILGKNNIALHKCRWLCIALIVIATLIYFIVS